jgi:hypothetical protein
MSRRELFGFACMSIMFVSYLFDKRARVWKLVLGLGCFGACAYAVMIGSIPFALIEALWGITAIQRWWVEPANM